MADPNLLASLIGGFTRGFARGAVEKQRQDFREREKNIDQVYNLMNFYMQSERPEVQQAAAEVMARMSGDEKFINQIAKDPTKALEKVDINVPYLVNQEGKLIGPEAMTAAAGAREAGMTDVQVGFQPRVTGVSTETGELKREAAGFTPIEGVSKASAMRYSPEERMNQETQLRAMQIQKYVQSGATEQFKNPELAPFYKQMVQRYVAFGGEPPTFANVAATAKLARTEAEEKAQRTISAMVDVDQETGLMRMNDVERPADVDPITWNNARRQAWLTIRNDNLSFEEKQARLEQIESQTALSNFNLTAAKERLEYNKWQMEQEKRDVKLKGAMNTINMAVQWVRSKVPSSQMARQQQLWMQAGIDPMAFFAQEINREAVNKVIQDQFHMDPEKVWGALREGLEMDSYVPGLQFGPGAGGGRPSPRPEKSAKDAARDFLLGDEMGDQSSNLTEDDTFAFTGRKASDPTIWQQVVGLFAKNTGRDIRNAVGN